MKLELILPNGKKRTVNVKASDELTLADWKKLTPIDGEQGDEFDALYRRVAIFTGLSTHALDKLPMKGVGEISDYIDAQIIEACKGSEAFRAALASDDATYVPPQTVAVEGVTYRVPYNLEHETTIGQWADWSRWEVPKHESDLVAEALAFLLVEDGKQYAGTPKAKVEAMGAIPIATAFDLCAFFFAKSERFRHATSQRSRSFQEWMSARVETALNPSATVGEALN